MYLRHGKGYFKMDVFIELPFVYVEIIILNTFVFVLCL